MRRAIARLGGHEHVLVDGNRIAGFEAQVGPYTAIVDGDAKVYSIACASVVAKVVRDRMMARLAARYPGYGWERNQGYATLEHRDAIRAHGPDAVPPPQRSWRSSGRSPATSSSSTCSAIRRRAWRRHELLEREPSPVMADDARRVDLADLSSPATALGRRAQVEPRGERADARAPAPMSAVTVGRSDADGTAQRRATPPRRWSPARLAAAGWTHPGAGTSMSAATSSTSWRSTRARRAALVVVEVRWRGRRGFGLAEETVDHRKRARAPRAALGACSSAASLPDGTPVPARCRCGSTSSSSSRPRTGRRVRMRHHRATRCRRDRAARRPATRPCATLRAGRGTVRERPTLPAPARAGAEHTRGPFRPGRCRPRPERRGRSPATRSAEERTEQEVATVPSVSMRQLLEAGVHFGHQTRRWNPKMTPVHLRRAQRDPHHRPRPDRQAPGRRRSSSSARPSPAASTSCSSARRSRPRSRSPQEATRAGQPYVNKRWLGGMLTNFITIKKRIGLLEQLEARQQAGDFERMTKKEAAKLTEEMTKLQAHARRHAQDEAPAGRHLHRRPAPRADRA